MSHQSLSPSPTSQTLAHLLHIGNLYRIPAPPPSDDEADEEVAVDEDMAWLQELE